MKRPKRRFKNEGEIIELIDRYKAELYNLIRASLKDQHKCKGAITYRENRLVLLKEALAELRTMMLHETEFGDASVVEHRSKSIKGK